MRTIWSRLTGFFGARRLDRDLDDEVRFHIEMLIDRYISEGMSALDARAAALREFGGVTQTKEAYRDQRSLPWLETFVQDARYGVRSLFRTPAFTLAALITLTLGIGANTAIFSVVNAMLLRPLPYPEPERIVQLVRRTGDGDSPSQSGARYLFFRDNLRSLDALAAWRGTTGFNLSTGDSAEFVKAMPVSKEFFQVFGVRPEYGEPFSEEQDRPGGPDAVVLSHGLWTRQFGANPSVVGTAVTLGDGAHTVIGVMPRGFVSVPPADLYIPLRVRLNPVAALRE